MMWVRETWCGTDGCSASPVAVTLITHRYCRWRIKEVQIKQELLFNLCAAALPETYYNTCNSLIPRTPTTTPPTVAGASTTVTKNTFGTMLRLGCELWLRSDLTLFWTHYVMCIFGASSIPNIRYLVQSQIIFQVFLYADENYNTGWEFPFFSLDPSLTCHVIVD